PSSVPSRLLRRQFSLRNFGMEAASFFEHPVSGQPTGRGEGMLLVAMVRTFSAILFLILYALFLGPVFILHAILTGSVHLLYPFCVGGAQIGLRIASVTPRAEGLEHIPPGVCLFVSNHVSNVDPPVVVGRIPRRVALLAKRELFRIPLLG